MAVLKRVFFPDLLRSSTLVESLSALLTFLQRAWRLDDMLDPIVSDGSTRIPYQEFTYTITPESAIDVFQVFDYFRVLAYNGTTGDLGIRLGQNGLQTPFTAAGVGIKCEDVFDRVTLYNKGTSDDIIITIALALGQVNDDRLTVSGTINVDVVASVPIITVDSGCSNFDTEQYDIDDTPAEINNGGGARRNVTIYNADAAQSLYIGDSNAVDETTGFEIPPQGAFTTSMRNEIWAVRVAGAAVGNVSVFYEFVSAA